MGDQVMEFYFEKFRVFKKKIGISTKVLSKAMGVHRATIWNWENGKKIPSELKVRSLAKILKISVDKISDIEPEYATSELNLSKMLDPWVQFADENSRGVFGKFKDYMLLIQEQYDAFQRSMIVSRALLSSIESILYIKDINNNYVTANRAFKNNLSLTSTYEVSGKNDSDFFNEKEASFNSGQDLNVIRSGKSLKNVEGYIPGSKKKKKGLISKVPIFDSKNKIVGIIVNFIDVTERINASQQRKIIEKVLKESHDIIWIREFPPSNKLLYLSDSVEDVYGYDKKHFIKDANFWYNNCLYDEDRTELLKDRNFTNWSKRKIHRIITKNNDIRWIEASILQITFQDKKCVAYIERDVTERIKERENIQNNTKIQIAEILKTKGIDDGIISEATGLPLESL
jgi:transcriptional regulator with XRE-family HTH domain